MSTITYPIAELFWSLQGEGLYAGTPIKFIRFAGCSVGRPLAANNPLFPLYTKCQSVTGSEFICDTNYQRTRSMTPQEIAKWVNEPPLVERVCLTGGEPLLFDLKSLRDQLPEKVWHLETSGTKPIPDLFDYVACSPKRGFLIENVKEIDEFKLLVESSTQLETLEKWLNTTLKEMRYASLIFLQPINGLSDIDSNSLQRCLDFLKVHPEWRLSVQMHKLLGVR